MKYLVCIALLLCCSIVSPSTTEAQSSCSMGGSGAPIELAVPNLTGQRVNVYWLNYNCTEEFIDTMEPDWIFYQSTYDGHEWVFRSDNGQEVGRFVASSSSPMVLLGGGAYNAEPVTSTCSTPGSNVDNTLTVINNTDDPALLFWIDQNCEEWLYWVVPAHDRVSQNAFVAHDWVVRHTDGRAIEQRTLAAGSNTIVIDPPPVSANATATPVPVKVAPATPAASEEAAFPVTESSCEVVSVTPAMGLDPFYTKVCDYNGLRFQSSAAVDDVALEQAWLVAANMFYSRPDVVQSMIDMGMFIAVMGEEEIRTDIPELAYLADDTSVDQTAFRLYSKVLEEPRLALVGEENLLCSATDTNAGENLLVGRLANLTRFVLVRDLDPAMNDQLTVIRQSAVANGLWPSITTLADGNNDYWDTGVQTYFNSAPGALLTGPTDSAINTRAELASYDPQLYALIDSVYQVDDWTPVCPS